MNNQKKRAPVKISKRFLNEQSERKNFIGLIEKYDLIISIMEHLTLSRKKSSSTFLEKASQIMSNEELNNFALKTYNILESAVVMWDMMGKGRDSAERNKIIRKRVYDSLNSLSSSETLSPTHAKSALGARSYGYYGGDPERTAYTKISEMKRRIIANTNANDKNTSYFFRYLFKALNPALFDEKTESETDFEKYSVFNNLSKLKSIDEAAAKVLKDFIFVSWLKEGDVVEFYLRRKQSIENSLITLIRRIKDKDFDNQTKADYLKLIFSVVNYIWDHFLPAEYYPHPGPHYYLQDISDNIFSDYEEGIYDYYKELLKENKNVIKEELKNPVRVSKRFLNEKTINESLFQVGPILVNLSQKSLLSTSEGRANPFSKENLPFFDKSDDDFKITEKELQSLRAAMSMRALLESGESKEGHGKFGSIGENLAVILLGGVNTNSRALGGDNTLFTDVAVSGGVAGDAYYSVKMKDAGSNRSASAPVKAITLKKTIKKIRGEHGGINAGILLIDHNQEAIIIHKKGPFRVEYDDIQKVEYKGKDRYTRPRNKKQRPDGWNPIPDLDSISGTEFSWNSPQKNLSAFFYNDKTKYEKYEIKIASVSEIENSIKEIQERWNKLNKKMYDAGLERNSAGDFELDPENLTNHGITQDLIDQEKILRLCQNRAMKELISNGSIFKKFNDLLSRESENISAVVKVFPFFGGGVGAAAGRSDRFLKSSIEFINQDPSIERRNFIYRASSLNKTLSKLLDIFVKNPPVAEELETISKLISSIEEKIKTDFKLKENNQTIKKINLIKEILEKKNIRKKRRRSKCRPARRRIASGGKEGSYASPRTGGKQAYAALKKAKPPGSRGGWTKKKCICCHKCPNDRSAPNGFVCTNPSHLYWGTKADNTYDQNRGNGWAARNKKKNEDDSNGEQAFALELMVSEDKIRKMISNILLEDAESESYFGKKFVDFKNAVDAGEEPLTVAKRLLNEIGRGSTRIVFDLPDNDGYVLKIINTEVEPTKQAFIGPDGNVMPNVSPEGDFRTKHGFFRSHMRQSNEWEADLIMQQKFPDVFPKTFEKAEDFSWILAEKALPIVTLDELINILGIKTSFSRFAKSKKREFIAMIKEAIEYFKNPDHRLRAVNESYDSTITGFNFDDKTNKETFSTDLFDVLPTQNNQEPPSDTILVANDKPYTPVEDPHIKRVKELISNAHNSKILGAMTDLGIPPREFLPKNLGISSLTGKLLIIDASLWEEKKKVR